MVLLPQPPFALVTRMCRMGSPFELLFCSAREARNLARVMTNVHS